MILALPVLAICVFFLSKFVHDVCLHPTGPSIDVLWTNPVGVMPCLLDEVAMRTS